MTQTRGRSGRSDPGRSAISPAAPAGAAEALPNALRRLRLRELEMLDLLGRTLSFSQTAEAAALSQPALSKWLRELEQELGVVLFVRTTRRVAPTVYGETVLASIERILADLGRLPAALGALRQGMGVPVSIGFLPGIAAVLLPQAIETLHRDGSAILLQMREGTLDQLLPAMQRRELDLLVCRLEATAMQSGLVAQGLYRDEVRVVATRRHPLNGRRKITWQDAAQYPWIAPASGTPMRRAIEAEFALAGLSMPRVVLESLSLPTNLAVADRLNGLFVSSLQSASRALDGDQFCFLPLKVSNVAPVVGLLHTAPAGAPVEAVIRALRNAAATLGTPCA
nr:LysR substrate-binding domain-containing protein [uncultured Ralstonia sp.]